MGPAGGSHSQARDDQRLMRKLIVIGADNYVRNFVEAGAFELIEDDETYYVAAARGVIHPETRAVLESRSNYLGEIPDSPRRARPYANLQLLLLSALRDRSRTIREKVRLLPPLQRIRFRVASHPRLRDRFVRRYLRRAGLNRPLHALMQSLRPDLVIAPSGGIDHFVTDALRSARELGIPSLVLVYNWDNLSSKGAFAVKPDYLAVWGEQSVEHAVRIHGFERDRVRILGVPAFDSYFHHKPGTTQSPFPFRYALFAGCYAPFDEAAALERLDRAIDEHGLDLKIVYRPHPHRRPRKQPDRVDEGRLRNIVLDPQVRDLYEASFKEYGRRAPRSKPRYPALDYYPALLENAEFTICPLSTMIVESAIFERRVIVIAYDDGIHPDSPAVVVNYDHFEGIDRVEGFEICRNAEALPRTFCDFASRPARPVVSLREQIRWWLHHDDRTYAERLLALVREVATSRIPADNGAQRAPTRPSLASR
jgi:hypothetical protein